VAHTDRDDQRLEPAWGEEEMEKTGETVEQGNLRFRSALTLGT
jgi:hypothetical protein